MIFYNNGHHLNDSGAIVGDAIERDILIKIGKKVKKHYPEAHYIPDNFNLRHSIEFVNNRCRPGDIALDIHINKSRFPYVGGIECYYNKNYALAQDFAKKLSILTGLRNRGPKHDTASFLRRLGWVRNLNCKSIVVEIGYLSHDGDRAYVTSDAGQEEIARAIANILTEKNKLKVLQAMLDKLKDLVAQLTLKVEAKNK